MLVDRMRQENKPLLKYFNKVSDLNLLLHYQRVNKLSVALYLSSKTLRQNTRLVIVVTVYASVFITSSCHVDILSVQIAVRI